MIVDSNLICQNLLSNISKIFKLSKIKSKIVNLNFKFFCDVRKMHQRLRNFGYLAKLLRYRTVNFLRLHNTLLFNFCLSKPTLNLVWYFQKAIQLLG